MSRQKRKRTTTVQFVVNNRLEDHLAVFWSYKKEVYPHSNLVQNTNTPLIAIITSKLLIPRCRKEKNLIFTVLRFHSFCLTITSLKLDVHASPITRSSAFALSCCLSIYSTAHDILHWYGDSQFPFASEANETAANALYHYNNYHTFNLSLT